MSIYFTEQHGNETTFVKENIFSEEKKWEKYVNLKEARILYAFSSNVGYSYENDKRISLIANSSKTSVPNLRVVLILETNFKNQIDNDSLFKEIILISKKQFNQYAMGISLENPGYCTILSHLITMRTKTIPETILKEC